MVIQQYLMNGYLET